MVNFRSSKLVQIVHYGVQKVSPIFSHIFRRNLAENSQNLLKNLGLMYLTLARK